MIFDHKNKGLQKLNHIYFNSFIFISYEDCFNMDW